MFDTVLIANRGAIACRVIRSLKRLGLKSVAVYSEADADSAHVAMADVSVNIGPPPAARSYLDVDRILQAARDTGAGAIHPGYGFLSENPGFAEACEAAGIAFIGPTPAQMRAFGLKHTARALAEQHGVPLLPGSGLLADVGEAACEAERIGYPVMLKSTAGGGGIGMRLVRSPDELATAFEAVARLAGTNFKDAGLFVEKFVEQARHIEVQLFGDGRGRVVALGERDCSAQRRHQKVVEETPAPHLAEATRSAMIEAAVRLAQAVSYRSAGTVEYVLDASTGAFYFLEVNTRLQVEHGVTEQVTGIDIVEWMLRLARGEALALEVPAPQGAAIQVRLYAEDPARQFQPCAGLLTEVVFPSDARIETWVARGTEVPPHYDPMIAKLIVTGRDRAEAVEKLQRALADTRLAGIETNLRYLRALAAHSAFIEGRVVTRTLGDFAWAPNAMEVLEPGVQTTVQDWPGRLGHWDVGVPPSGPMDDLSHRLANRLVGNAASAPALELTLAGPTLKLHADAVIALVGAEMPVLASIVRSEPSSAPGGERAQRHGAVPVEPGVTDSVTHHSADRVLAFGQAHRLPAGTVLRIGQAAGAGLRATLAVRGGFDLPQYLGSAATFTLGQFGGHGGRTLRAGDLLHVGEATEGAVTASPLPPSAAPALTRHWDIGVLYGPHGAPDFFTDADIDAFFATDWEVHYNSSRTGVRLIGPKPQWARPDGGEAGLHPSNIHDNAYAIGAIDFTGDMPVILGPDGPSLGGFVCPAVVIAAERWKLGQLKPGDRLRFRAVAHDTALAMHAAQNATITSLQGPIPVPVPVPVPVPDLPADSASTSTSASASTSTSTSTSTSGATWPAVPVLTDPSLLVRPAAPGRPAMVVRQAGDRYLLLELGEPVLDIALRLRVHALMQSLRSMATAGDLPGLIDLTPGIRSLQLHFDPAHVDRATLLSALTRADEALGPTEDLQVPSRTVWLPLSWDDPSTRLAIEKYMQSVRPDAPWCPSNIEFIRRINGLASIDDVFRTVFDAPYLVLGLGDVYLGAPVATPLDPRHRLVTTKYNPARTWTPENAVGIGGAYLCIYGMEGPGGYQFVGRTLQMWNRWRDARDGAADFEPGKPWLLRFFDQIRFYPVSGEELAQIRRDFPAGRHRLRIEPGQFSLREHEAFLQANAESIAAFRSTQRAAFAAERDRWREAGQAEFVGEPEATAASAEEALPPGARAITTQVPGGVWRVLVEPGQAVQAGETLLVVESMKTEFAVTAPVAGRVLSLNCREGASVSAGQTVVVLGADRFEAVRGSADVHCRTDDLMKLLRADD